MKRISRRWTPFLGGMVAAILLVVAVLLALTRTDRGREKILAITLETLGGQLHPNAALTVGRLEGGLFTGARMYDITLRDAKGEEMVAADSAYIQYRLPTFFAGDIVIDDLVLFDAEVLLYRLPGDSLWNYQEVLQDTAPPQPGRVGRATILNELRLVNSELTVRMEWQPDEDLSRAEREREIEEALADTSRLAVEEVEDGYVRTIVVTTPETVLEGLTVAPDERGGTYLRVVRSDATVHLYRDNPIQIRDLQGELSLLRGVVRYQAPVVQFPGSRLSTEGVLDMSGDEAVYDVRVSGSDIALRDLQWLYPRFPEEGRATFSAVIDTRQPESLFVRMTDLQFETPGTRLVGDFSMRMGEELLFSDVDLRADPLDVETVQAMLPTSLPVRGLAIGAVEVRSSAS